MNTSEREKESAMRKQEADDARDQKDSNENKFALKNVHNDLAVNVKESDEMPKMASPSKQDRNDMFNPVLNNGS